MLPSILPSERPDPSDIVGIIARVGATLAGELDLEKIVQSATDAATKLSGAQFGAFFYNVVNAAGESYMLYTISGVPREAFSKFPMPRNTAVFAPTFNGDKTVRSGDIKADPRYGHSAPHYGQPKGHLPVRSYLATPVISRSGEVIGGLFFGHSETDVFTEQAETFVEIIASQAAVAIDNARLFEREKLSRQEAQASAAALRKLQERFDIVVDATDLGVWYCDLPFDKLIWNTKVKEHFWLPPDAEVTIDLFYRQIHPHDRERTRQAIENSLARKDEYDIDYRTISESGEIKWIRARGRGVYDAAGNPVRFDGITIDMTSRKRSEELLIKSEKLAATGRMAATIAHEINNPLEAVTNLLYLTRNHSGLPEQAAQWLEMADAELTRVSHITKQTLGFYRESTRPGRFQLRDALGQAISLFELRARQKGVRLTSQVEEGVTVFGFAGEIKQVIANLISNAIDAARADGDVVLRGRRTVAPDGTSGVRIVVADNGSGIDAKNLAHIFEPFFTTKRDVGTGLGLWVTQEIVRKHGGTVRVRSAVLQNGNAAQRCGTIFTIFLPDENTSTAQSATA